MKTSTLTEALKKMAGKATPGMGATRTLNYLSQMLGSGGKDKLVLLVDFQLGSLWRKIAEEKNINDVSLGYFRRLIDQVREQVVWPTNSGEILLYWLATVACHPTLGDMPDDTAIPFYFTALVRLNDLMNEEGVQRKQEESDLETLADLLLMRDVKAEAISMSPELSSAMKRATMNFLEMFACKPNAILD